MHITRISLVALLLAASPACSKESAESPKAAWTEFSAALENGQPKRLDRVVVTSDAARSDALREAAAMVGELISFGDAATKRWGAQAGALTQVRESLAGQLAPFGSPAGDASIAGDSATLPMSSGKVVQFRRVRGGWKLDLDALPMLATPKEVAAWTDILRAWRQCLRTMTASVDDEEATFEQVMTGLTGCVRRSTEDSVLDLEQARVDAARSDLRAIQSALQAYRAKTGRYPDSDAGLKALVEAGLLRELKQDPWGDDYSYTTFADRAVVRTLGADRVQGGEGFDADLSTADAER